MLRATIQALKIVTIATMAIVTVLGGQRFFDYAIDRSAAADAGRRVRFEVSNEPSIDEVAARLKRAGLIRSPDLFKAQLRFTNSTLLPGNYTLRKGMTLFDIADTITGKTVAAEESESVEFDITIPEGYRIEQIAEEAEAQGLEGGYDALLAATETINLDTYEFLEDRPEGVGLEGYLFPNTYTFLSDEPEYNLRLMLDQFDAQFTPEMRDRAAEMGLTIHEVVTLASLIEREAAVDAERPIIADIYIKRLEEGWNLEADPTMQYALGEPGEWWPELGGSDLDGLDPENPYNSYKNLGLPPAPIANPGIASLQAVLYPEETPYYFFVGKADGSGEHAFGATKAEQDQNLCKYLDVCGT